MSPRAAAAALAVSTRSAHSPAPPTAHLALLALQPLLLLLKQLVDINQRLDFLCCHRWTIRLGSRRRRHGQISLTKMFAGVDVGTAGARASIFDERGELVAQAERAFPREPLIDELWSAVRDAIGDAAAQAAASGHGRVVALAFDAACSMVLVDAQGVPTRRLLPWFSLCAASDAARLSEHTNSDSTLRRHLGAHELNPELNLVKLAYLLRAEADVVERTAHFFDLCDWLAFRCTGSLQRSVCALRCKWPFVDALDVDFLREASLQHFVDHAQSIVGDVEPGLPGARHGTLNQSVASEFGLPSDTTVAVGMVDAHAGTLSGLAGAQSVRQSASLVLGTSACLMALSEQEHFVPRAWCCHKDVVVPGFFLCETGLSACGSFLDDCLALHPHTQTLQSEAASMGLSVHYLLGEAARKANCVKPHIVFPRGNRIAARDVPAIEEQLESIVFDESLESLLHLYVGAVEGLAVSIAFCVSVLRAHGFDLTELRCMGSVAQNTFLLAKIASVAQCRVVCLRGNNQMCLGAAMCANAAHCNDSLINAINRMQNGATTSLTIDPPNCPERLKALLESFSTFVGADQTSED